VVTAGLPGVMLGVFVLVVTGTCCILADRLLGGSGIAGAAASSTAGNSAAVPKAIALADPTYAAIAAAATIQVAASVIVTAVLTPVLTSFVYKRVQKKRTIEARAVGGDELPLVGGLGVAPGSHADLPQRRGYGLTLGIGQVIAAYDPTPREGRASDYIRSGRSASSGAGGSAPIAVVPGHLTVARIQTFVRAWRQTGQMSCAGGIQTSIPHRQPAPPAGEQRPDWGLYRLRNAWKIAAPERS
jgi:hypothetical protein